MNYFSIRTNNQDTIGKILKQNVNVEFDTLSWHREEVQIDDIIFIIISGDNAKKQYDYDNGLKAIGKVVSRPKDSGDDKHFSLKIQITSFFSRVLTRDDFFIFPSIKDAPAIGPITRNEPNQAFRMISETQGQDIIRAIFKILDISEITNYNDLKSIITNGFEIQQYQLLNIDSKSKIVSVNTFKKRNFNIETFKNNLQNIGFHYNPSFVKSLIISLLTKNFIILTGNSGSGKTKIAQNLASWLNRTSIGVYSLLAIALKDEYIKNKYIIDISDKYVDLINKEGSSQKIISLPKDAIIEWFQALKDKTLTIDDDPKNRDKVAENSKYQKYIHGYYSNFFDIAKVMYKLSEDNENCEQTQIVKQYCLLPVGAGWTDSRPILGFYNSLQNIYQTTPALELILDAAANPDLPFFLILDEMNLSHVERYFSDFLSAMESGEEIPLHTHDDEVKSPGGKSVPKRIAMPQNLFVIGTVNVDETTYMFSPKVLDRANVIEFRVTEDDIENYFSKRNTETMQIQPADPGTAEAFLSLSKRARGLKLPELPEAAEIDKLESALQDVFQILQKRGFEFAYRSASEIIRFASVSYELAETGADGKKIFDIIEVIDTQILQKLLPKLHGSRKKMENLLAALAQYCIDANLETALKQFDKCDVRTDVSVYKDSPVVYKNSYRKLAEMLESVRRDQFVSFIQ